MIFPAAVLLNIVMIVSTPTQGGHYLVDVLAGILFGAGIIWSFRWLSQHSMRREATAPRDRYTGQTVERAS
ncbi:hypothetical protein AU476_04455 [Cupriavidus sp. UYMSc13B]|nr:hypothetical protein AU476_04455 [Cupriavidus sp. UYMSc13B]